MPKAYVSGWRRLSDIPGMRELAIHYFFRLRALATIRQPLGYQALLNLYSVFSVYRSWYVKQSSGEYPLELPEPTSWVNPEQTDPWILLTLHVMWRSRYMGLLFIFQSIYKLPESFRGCSMLPGARLLDSGVAVHGGEEDILELVPGLDSDASELPCTLEYIPSTRGFF